MPIPGFRTATVGNLRLWEAQPVAELDLAAFNDGRFEEAAAAARKAAEISAVLYPNDATEEGKLLRLKQQYFFVSASLQDVIARFKATPAGMAGDWAAFPDFAIFQMNDTHPTCAVTELLRLLIDVEGVDHQVAWGVTTRALAFTNHTVMPEALEKWPATAFAKLLPRNYELVAKLDAWWRAQTRPAAEAYVAAHPPPPPPPAEVEVEEAAPAAKGAIKAGAKGAAKAAKKAEPKVPAVDPVEAAIEAQVDKTAIIVENAWEPGVKCVPGRVFGWWEVCGGAGERCGAPLDYSDPAHLPYRLCSLQADQHGAHGHRGVVRRQRRGRYPLGNLEERPVQRVLCHLSRQIPKQDQRRDPPPLAGVLQPGRSRPHHRCPGHRRLGQGRPPSGGLARLCGGPRLPGPLARGQAGQQGPPGGQGQGGGGRGPAACVDV